MNDKRRQALGCVALAFVLLAGGLLDQAAAQAKPLSVNSNSCAEPISDAL